ncbi:MAG: hypothetical protein IIZ61_09170 [Lachnospiraceae bacterium]|nr:hypothetical protein [Lachnospiraceae bacterium]
MQEHNQQVKKNQPINQQVNQPPIQENDLLLQPNLNINMEEMTESDRMMLNDRKVNRNYIEKMEGGKEFSCWDIPLSQRFYDAAIRIAEDTRDASKDFFAPLKLAANSFIHANNPEYAAEQLGSLLEKALLYVDKRKGFRFGKGSSRKEACYDIIFECGDFLEKNAPERYQRAIKKAIDNANYPKDVTPTELNKFKKFYGPYLLDDEEEYQAKKKKTLEEWEEVNKEELTEEKKEKKKKAKKKADPEPEPDVQIIEDEIPQELNEARDNVEQKMPVHLTDVYDEEKLNALLGRQDRMVSDLSKMNKKDHRFDAMRQSGDIQKTKEELDEINKILRDYANIGGEISMTRDANINALTYKKTLDLAHILVNDKSGSDFTEIKNVKIELIKLSMALEGYKNVQASKQSIDEICACFALSLKCLEDYLQSPKSEGTKERERYDVALDLHSSLSYIQYYVHLYREDGEALAGKTLGSILGMRENKEDDVVREYVSEEDNVPYELSEDGKFVLKLFSQNFDFSAGFSGAKVGENKRKTESGKVVSLYNQLARFKPGTTQIEDCEIYGKKVRIIQKEDNRLYLVENHNTILLGKTAMLLHDQIERDMFKKSAAYGGDNLLPVLEKYKDNRQVMTTGYITAMRANLIEFLTVKLKVKRDEFNTISRRNMITYVEALVTGEKTAEEIKNKMQADKKLDEQRLINGVELVEMMELDETRQQEIDQNVSYKIEYRSRQRGWTEEEKSVQNLLADFVYTDDTLIMDKNVDTPEEYVRTVLLNNVKAVATLIKEGKGENEDLISSIMKKMSLDSIMGEGNENFAKVIAENLRDFCNYLKGKINFKEDAGVEQISDLLKDVLENKNDEGMTGLLKSSYEIMNESIKKSCDILQENVTKITNSIFAESAADKETNLQAILKNATRTKKGQGKFTRNVLENYFKSVPEIDKRAMLSSVLRSSKKVEDKLYTRDELIEDLKVRKLKGYESIWKDGRNFIKEPLTPAERNKLLKYRTEKQNLNVGANYLGGLIRGAGPLFQKMIQGLPDESLPEEIKIAKRDVKSKLPPIPERVVKSQLNAMIQKSQGTITKIEVLKNLGAASVGQTFKCKLYGPNLPAEGKGVVIKLLRPDAANRMAREEEILLNCAKTVDGEGKGMHLTFQGQLANHKAELDLTKEANNIEAGKVYDGKFKDVECEKINTLIDPTVNSLVLEEAEGKTLDDILIETEIFRQDIRSELGDEYELTLKLEDYDKTKECRDKLIDKVNELIKKRDMMANVTHRWVEEAIFKGGYYHADLHAGNILIGDDKATLIDFGNAVQFTADQKAAITKMILAASSSHEENFFDAFCEILLKKEGEEKTPEDIAFEAFFNEEKKTALRNEIDKIFDMSEGSEAGERISAVLIKAQQLGIKLPPEIFNFSQGQLRLQQSINDINKMVTTLKKDIEWIEDACDRHNQVDPVSYVQINIYEKKVLPVQRGEVDETNVENKAVFKSYVDMFEDIDKEEFIKELLDNKKVKPNLAKNFEGIDKRDEFDKKYLGDIKDIAEKLKIQKTNKYGFYPEDRRKREMIVPDFTRPRRFWNLFKAIWADADKPFEIPKEYSIEDLFSFMQCFSYSMPKASGVPDLVSNLSLDRKENGLTEKDRPKLVNALNTIRQECIKRLGDNEVKSKAACNIIGYWYQGELNQPVYDQFGGFTRLSVDAYDILKSLDEKKIDELIKIYDVDIQNAVLLDQKIKELRELQDKSSSKFNSRKEELTNEIYTIYNDLHKKKRESNPITGMFKTMIQRVHGLNGKATRDNMAIMFKIDKPITLMEDGKPVTHEKGGEYFKQLYDDYEKIALEITEEYSGDFKEGVSEEKKADYEKKKQKVIDAHVEIIKIELKDYYEGHYARKPDVKSYDFSKVMLDVVKANPLTFIMNVGAGNLAKQFGQGMFAMMKKIANLGE